MSVSKRNHLSRLHTFSVFLILNGTAKRSWQYFSNCNSNFANASVYFFNYRYWKTSDLFVGPLIPLFWTSFDACPGFRSQSGFPCLYVSSPERNGFLRFTLRYCYHGTNYDVIVSSCELTISLIGSMCATLGLVSRNWGSVFVELHSMKDLWKAVTAT